MAQSREQRSSMHLVTPVCHKCELESSKMKVIDTSTGAVVDQRYICTECLLKMTVNSKVKIIEHRSIGIKCKKKIN